VMRRSDARPSYRQGSAHNPLAVAVPRRRWLDLERLARLRPACALL